MTIQHNIIADPDIHEPKGVATAASNSLYVANGSGSGVWQTVDTSSLADGAVETAKIEDLNVTGAKVANQTLAPTKLAGITTNGTANQLLRSNADGTVSWTDYVSYAGAYLAFSTISPYAFSATTSDAVINPTLIAGALQNFTILTSPNFRIRYDGTENSDVAILVTFSSQQASGTGRDAEWVLFKNGTEVNGTRTIRSLSSSDWGSITVIGNITMSTNDYVELYCKASASCTINFASLAFTLNGALA